MFPDIPGELHVQVLFMGRDRRLCWPISSPIASSRGWHALPTTFANCLGLSKPRARLHELHRRSFSCIEGFGVILRWLAGPCSPTRYF